MKLAATLGFLILTLGIVPAFAEPSASQDFPAQCSDSNQVIQNLEAASSWDAAQSSCMVSIDPLNALDLIYRSYLFNEDGLVMVFNSFGSGPDSTTTGARDFYFFPRKEMPAYRDEGNGLFEVRMSNGELATFSTQNSSILKLANADVKLASDIRPDNQGGIELHLKSGIMLDCGFSVGHQPESLASGKSRFVDSKGAECEVTNKEVFEYRSGGNFKVRFKTDAELSAFLATRCPGISTQSLL